MRFYRYLLLYIFSLTLAFLAPIGAGSGNSFPASITGLRLANATSYQVAAKNVNSYGGLEAAVAKIGSTKITIFVNDTQTLTGDLETNVNTTLKIVSPGIISDGGGAANLAIKGPFRDPGPVKCFDFTGSGAVTFGPGSTPAQYLEWHGGTSDGVDSTAAMKRCLVSLKASTVKKVQFLAGNYAFNDELDLYSGMILQGMNEWPATMLQSGLTAADIQTKITFTPTSEKSLFHINNEAPDSYSTKVKIAGVYMVGNTTGGVTNSKYAIHAEANAQSVYDNLGIERFQGGIYCDFTMTNTYSNSYIGACSVSCVNTSTDTNTTDTFTNCIFRASPWGVILQKAVFFRFINCLFESLTVGGANVYGLAGADFVSCYSENTPSGVGGTDYGMFYVKKDATGGYTVNINGGSYTGCNGATKYGSFVDAGYTRYYTGINISNVKVYGFVNGIMADLTNSGLGSVNVNNISFEGVTNPIVNGWKTSSPYGAIISGVYPYPDALQYQRAVGYEADYRRIYLRDLAGYGGSGLYGQGGEMADDGVYYITNFADGHAALIFVVMSAVGINESGIFSINADAAGNTTVVKLVGTANTDIADVDGNLTVYPSTTSVIIKNRLGATVNCRVSYIR